MKTFGTIILVLLAIWIASCSSTETLLTPEPLAASPKVETFPTVTIHSPTAPVETATAKPSEQVSPTIAIPTNSSYSIDYRPLEILSDLPPGGNLPGSLVLFGLDVRPEYRLDFTRHIEQEFPEEVFCWSVSPDGTWLAYCEEKKDPSSSDLLIIESADGNRISELAIEEDWEVYLSPTWLDNQRLVFNLPGDENLSILPVVVVNPFTGEKQKIATDYPDLRPMINGPAGTLHFRYSTVVYHPSLNLVIYPQTTAEGTYVVLWDRRTRKVLARVRDLGGFGRYPQWSPDMEQFVVAVIDQGGKRPNDHSEFFEEWFRVSKDGEVQQLTHFAEFFDHSQIGPARWSPDGKYLAFWLETKPSLCAMEQNLAVMEMKTGIVTNYCVPAVIGANTRPVWSPDGEYIAVESWEDGLIRVIVINIDQNWAVQVAEESFPMGWLRSY